MKGLIVKSNISNKETTLNIALPNSPVSVSVEMVNMRNGFISYNIGGLQLPEGIIIDWAGGDFHLGDTIEIEVADIAKPDSIIRKESHFSLVERMDIATNKDINENEEEKLQFKLERYNCLKAILEKESLIDGL